MDEFNHGEIRSREEARRADRRSLRWQHRHITEESTTEVLAVYTDPWVCECGFFCQSIEKMFVHKTEQCPDRLPGVKQLDLDFQNGGE